MRSYWTGAGLSACLGCAAIAGYGPWATVPPVCGVTTLVSASAEAGLGAADPGCNANAQRRLTAEESQNI
ncbi:MAG: hypothetical protein PF904_12155 [Kiritimatiellae bacterium]|nr:hypothetical protein [Kiritimatiellia bacterium]